MKIKRIHAVYFSATDKTKKAVTDIAKEVSAQTGLEVMEDDFTKVPDHQRERTYTEDDFVIFGVPTYAGRIPNKVLPFVQTLFRGHGTKAAAVVTFGNRSYDNSLIELRNELTKAGFKVLAAGAFVCRHTFVEIGIGRPDEEDMALRKEYAHKIAGLINEERDIDEPLYVKGDDPVEKYYTPLDRDGKPANFLKAKPVTDRELCDKCMICAGYCPMGAISREDPALVEGVCIKCHACVYHCPKKAKYFDDPVYLSHKEYLEEHCQRRAESEIFLTKW